MALPRQVKKQIEEIEALEKQLQETSESPVDVSEDTPVEEPKVVEAETKDEDPVVTELTEEEINATEEAEAPKVEPKSDDDDAKVWEQRYKTLKGMYDKEVPKLHADLKELKKELDKSNKALETLKTAQEKRLVTDEDVENFGEDMVDFQRRVAQEVSAKYEAQIEMLQSELQDLKGETKRQVAETTFSSELHRLVPDFDEINADPKWIAWLDAEDPILRAPRRTVAQSAFESGDAEGVAYYVKMFREQNNVEPPKGDAPKKELERQIQPNRTASTKLTSTANKTYTNADITAMFKKAALLSSAGKIDAAKKLEAEIDSAYAQGRVVG